MKDSKDVQNVANIMSTFQFNKDMGGRCEEFEQLVEFLLLPIVNCYINLGIIICPF